MKKLLLVDASNLLFRSYYATAYSGNLMQNKEGLYTNGIFGFAHAMTKFIDNGYTHILVALDCVGKTHRHEEFKEYKGTRKETPEELKMQFPLMKEYMDALGVYYYEQEKMEADDIIGYAAKHFKDKFDEIMIYSNDHDLMQLLDDNVSQIVSRRGLTEIEVFTPEYLYEKLGFNVDQVVDYKGLVGDTSDNIPGIPGVGQKTATKLLNTYPHLEDIYEHIGDIKGKMKEKLEENKGIAIFSKKLATILTEFENDIDIKKTEYKGYDRDKLINFYQRMNFYSFIKKLGTPENYADSTEFKYIKKSEEIKEILKDSGYVHLEYFGTNYHISQKLGFGLIFGDNKYYIPYETGIKSEDFKAWLANPKKKKNVFDLKTLKVMLLWDGLDLNGVEFDLLLSTYLNNAQVNQDDIAAVCGFYGYHDVLFDEQVYGKGAKYSLPEEEKYIQHILSKTLAIKQIKEEALDKNKENEQHHLLVEIEMPLAEALAEMEVLGINVDIEGLDSFGSDLLKKIKDLEEMIYNFSGQKFNINSPKQLGEILFEKLALPSYKKGKSGYSTDISVLKKLNKFHPIINYIMQYRTYTKLYSTYYEGLKQALKLKDDGRIHTMYQQALTKTGRLSSREPNLQNIPIRNEEGRELRKVFVPSIGNRLLSFDYSQIELRVLAEIADVKGLRDAFNQGRDIHEETAKMIFAKDNISLQERSIAKTVNFSIIYGKTVWGLSEDLNISPKSAEQIINSYYESYPEIKTYMDQIIDFAKENGYVKTRFNRRSYIPEISSKNYQTRKFGQRIAMNAPIQGTAADILKIAMVKIQNKFDEMKIKSKMILQIHDEIVLDVVDGEMQEVIDTVKNIMENTVEFNTKLTVNYASGNNLYEVK